MITESKNKQVKKPVKSKAGYCSKHKMNYILVAYNDRLVMMCPKCAGY